MQPTQDSISNLRDTGHNRRIVDRRTPFAHESIAYLSYSGSEPVEVLVCDISSEGIGILVDDELLKAVADRVDITYLNSVVAGTIVNRTEFDSKCNRLGISWDREQPWTKQFDSHTRYLIFVKRLNDDQLVLEQFRPEGRSQVVLSELELAKTIAILSQDNRTPSQSLSESISPLITVRWFGMDGSFCIEQNTTSIYGDGDIRRFLQPV